MGTPVERQNLSYWFFILAALIALSTLWSVYDEAFTRRPWKLYQERFQALEESHARADVASAKQQVEARKGELAALEKARDEAARELARGDAASLTRRQFVLDLEVKDAKQNIAFAKSDLDAAYYVFRQAREAKDERRAGKAQVELAKLGERIASLQSVLDGKQAALADAAAKASALEAKRATIEAKIAEIHAPVADAEHRLETARSRGVAMEQYWLPKLGRVDRCQNCHAGVDRCGFSQPWEAVAAKAKGGPGFEDDAAVGKRFCVTPGTIASYAAISAAFCEGDPVEKIGGPDVACRDDATLGRWRELVRLYCGPKAAPPAKWWLEGGKPCSRKDVLAALDAAERQRDYDVPFVFQTHPLRTELFASHPTERFGCTVCHGGEGVQTKGVEHAAFDHGRDDHFWGEWQDPLLAKVEIWGRKVDLTHAACNKCHQQDLSLAHADWLNRGKRLVADIACYGCHPIDGFNDLRKVGPQLTNLQAKTSPGWLVSWIQYPRDFRPRTRMPNFWPEAVEDQPDDAHRRPGVGKVRAGTKELQVRTEEATAIAAYLWTTSSPPVPPKALEGTPEEGQRLFETVGCRGCHTVEPGDRSRPNEATPHRDFAPNLSNVGAKTSASWIYTWIKNPKGYWPGTKMPSLRLSDREAGSIAKWLAQKTGGRSYEAPPQFRPGFPPAELATLAARGKSLIGKYGCFGCHDIKGFEDAQRIGVDLSEFGGKAVDLLDFGDAITNPVQQTWFNWVDTKLRHPRIYRYERVDTRMPQFDLAEDEVRALVTFLRAQKPADRPERSYLAAQSDRGKAVLDGEKLVQQYGCRNCHVVDGEGGRIRDLYPGDLVAQAPPVITGEGWKTQPDWLFQFLKSPRTGQIRPWLQVRMPTFGMSDADATTLVRYFSAKDDKPWPYVTVDVPPLEGKRLADARAMFEQLQCLHCHTKGAPPPGVAVSDLAPDLTQAHRRLRPDWIPAWLADPQKLMDGTRMPAFFTDGQTPLPQYFGGDAAEQMRALRDYIFQLGAPPAEAGAAPPKAARRRAGSALPAG